MTDNNTNPSKVQKTTHQQSPQAEHSGHLWTGDMINDLRNLLKAQGRSKPSDDCHKFGPTLRMLNHAVTDEQVRTRLKNNEYQWYDNYLREVASGIYTELPHKAHNNNDYNTHNNNKNDNQTKNNDNIWKTFNDNEYEPYTDSEADTDDDIANNEELSQSKPMLTAVATLPVEFVSPQLTIAEHMEMIVTDLETFVVVPKSPRRDVVMGVVPHPNTRHLPDNHPLKLGKVIQVEVTTVSAPKEDINRIIGSEIDILTHLKPVISVSYCNLPKEVLANGKYRVLVNDNLQGLILMTNHEVQDMLTTQTSIETVMRPVPLGMPMNHPVLHFSPGNVDAEIHTYISTGKIEDKEKDK